MADKKTKRVIIILAILLVLSLGYIAYMSVANYHLGIQINAYEQGFLFGYEQAVIQLLEIAVTCQEVPVTLENKTLNLIAVDCLATPQQDFSQQDFMSGYFPY